VTSGVTTLDELQQLIAQKENTRVEFKREVSDSVIQSMSTSVAAMSNAQGGVIIFGVTNQEEPAGCLLKGNDRDRISQEASNCQPVVKIELEEVPFGSRSFLLVKVPRSNVVHNDSQRKFPVRVGNITGYLDAYGVISLLQERGLIRPESAQQATSLTEQPRLPLSAKEMALLSRGLESVDPVIRLEAVRDLTATPFKQIVIEDPSIAKIVQHLLQSGSAEEKGLILDLVRHVANWGTAKEKEIVTSWMDIFTTMGKTSPPEIARKAFDALQSARRREAVDVLLHWIKTRNDEDYTQLQPGSSLANISYYGLSSYLRAGLYGLLENTPDERIKKRTLEALKAVRSSF
jgi:hypothetical protein